MQFSLTIAALSRHFSKFSPEMQAAPRWSGRYLATLTQEEIKL
jgi:hypothetical protein